MSDPIQAYGHALGEYRQSNTSGPTLKLLQAKREAVKEEMALAGCKPDRRQELAGAAQVLDDLIKDLTKPL